MTPAINQVELHPYFQQAELRRQHDELGIVTEAWSPLAQGRCSRTRRSCGIAEAHARTPGQIVIRWHLQLGNVVIPKSVTPGADRGELRRLRLRAQRGRDGRRSRSSTRAGASAPTPTRSSAPSRVAASWEGLAKLESAPVERDSLRVSPSALGGAERLRERSRARRRRRPPRRTAASSSSGVRPWVMIATAPPARCVSSGRPATGWTSSEEPMHSSTSAPARTAPARAPSAVGGQQLAEQHHVGLQRPAAAPRSAARRRLVGGQARARLLERRRSRRTPGRSRWRCCRAPRPARACRPCGGACRRSG